MFFEVQARIFVQHFRHFRPYSFHDNCPEGIHVRKIFKYQASFKTLMSMWLVTVYNELAVIK